MYDKEINERMINESMNVLLRNQRRYKCKNLTFFDRPIIAK